MGSRTHLVLLSFLGILRSNPMNKTEESRPSAKEEPQSNIYEAIVQCDGYRCWARQNAKHEWLDSHGNKLKVIEVLTVLG